MSLTYFGFSTVLLAFLLIVLCAAALWLVLDSSALWRQFRDQRAMMQGHQRRTFFDRTQRLPRAAAGGASRSGLRIVVFKPEDDSDRRPARFETRPNPSRSRLGSSDR